MNRRLGALRIAFLLVLITLAPGCRESSAPRGESPASSGEAIYTTFYPTTYLTERLVGDRITVVCPLPEGEDPIFWMPSTEIIMAYQKATLIVLNGAGLEKWVDRVSLPTSRVVTSARLLESGLLRYENAVAHTHGPEGEHTHEGLDGHTWLDPENARVQATEIMNALMKRFPEHREAFVASYGTLDAELQALSSDFEELTEVLGDTPLLASHPAYNYVARRFGWNLRNLDLVPDLAPGVQELDSIRALLSEHAASVILWESEPGAEVASALATLGLSGVLFSPGETLDAAARERGFDYIDLQRGNLARLRAAILAR